MTKPRCTCLIPVYNEGNKLLETVERLNKVKEIDSFLIVDDGSTDGSVGLLKKKFPKLKILFISLNKGKSDAVREGLKHVSTEYTLLFDADIKNIIPDEISLGLKKAFKISPGMVILRRMKSPLIPILVRSDTLLSGERLIKTTVAKKAMNQKPTPHKYEMESVLNQYCVDNNIAAYWYPASTKNTFKIYKIGLVRGILGDINTLFKEATKVGKLNYIKQIMFFCKTELK